MAIARNTKNGSSPWARHSILTSSWFTLGILERLIRRITRIWCIRWLWISATTETHLAARPSHKTGSHRSEKNSKKANTSLQKPSIPSKMENTTDSMRKYLARNESQDLTKLSSRLVRTGWITTVRSTSSASLWQTRSHGCSTQTWVTLKSLRLKNLMLSPTSAIKSTIQPASTRTAWRLSVFLTALL